MLAKVFEAFYHKIFINIVVGRSTTHIFVEVHNKQDLVSHSEHQFQTTELCEEIIDLVRGLSKDSPYYYISLLDTSLEQGALPTCEKQQLSLYKDISTSEYKCVDENWCIYTSKTDLYAIERRYKAIGLDFVFSPFSILNTFYQDKISKLYAMFVLIEESRISVAIFENSKLIYGHYGELESQEENEEILLEEDDIDDVDLGIDVGDGGIDLDSLDVDDEIEDVEGFADIDDLDTLDDLDDFSQKDLEEELDEEVEELASEENTQQNTKDTTEFHFNEDYQRFTLIQEALKHFYKDDRYESKFVENIYIADSVQVSADLKHYLEDEMFLNVYIRSIDMGEYMTLLAKEELAL